MHSVCCVRLLQHGESSSQGWNIHELVQVGSSFGATCGLLLMNLLPTWNIQPGLYAMVAATAMLGGVFRASISLVVLLVEGTQARVLYSHNVYLGIGDASYPDLLTHPGHKIQLWFASQDLNPSLSEIEFNLD